MSFFFGRKSGVDTTAQPLHASDFETQLQTANEDLYKHSLELALKNKTLSLLGQLYEISILTLNSKELAHRFCQIIQTDFDFELVGLLQYELHTDEFTALAFAQSPHFEALQHAQQNAYDISQLMTCPQSDFFKRVVLEKHMVYTEDFTEICNPSISDDIVKTIHADSHIRSSLVYPLIIEGEVLGVLVLSLNRIFHDLADSELKSIENLVNVIAVALDKAFLYEKLAATNKELVAANERQSNLIHFISHEVKGFLTKDIAAFSGLIEGDYGTLPDAAQALATGALAQSRDGARAVTDMLEASNLKEGTVHYTMAIFDLKEAVHAIFQKLEPLAIKKNLGLSLVCDQAQQYMINGDRSQLEDHVLRNLIENAINYTKEGSVSLVLKKEENKIIFSITDTGVGISEEDMPRLFTEGGHGKDAIKINVNSTGYGLYIARNIVDAHQGTIEVRSQGVGQGSTFVVTLPCVS